jgi:hypothetical protein
MISTYQAEARTELIPILHPIGTKGRGRGQVLRTGGVPEIGSVKVPITSVPRRRSVPVKVSQRPL